MTATIHFIVSPPYSLSLGAHHCHLEEEMGIVAITSLPLLHGRSSIFLLWFVQRQILLSVQLL